ncbi:MAG TPA: albumin-binding protein, partial [bacterium]|nr:albumin-binding protein [bacterium]
MAQKEDKGDRKFLSREKIMTMKKDIEMAKLGKFPEKEREKLAAQKKKEEEQRKIEEERKRMEEIRKREEEQRRKMEEEWI